jgi:hypothetical protein
MEISEHITFRNQAVTLRTARFNIQKFHMVLTQNLCVLYGSQKKTAIISLYSINRLVFITEVESVYCAVRAVLI